MTIKDMRLWIGKAAYVVWLDSGSWDQDPDTEPKDMELSITGTSGVIVFVNRKKLIIEHEKESANFGRQSHSVIWPKAIISISSKKPK
jgi:hypothetical protein